MKLVYDKEADAAYIYIAPSIKRKEVKKTVEINQDVYLDYDKNGKILGLEILSASKLINKKTIASAKKNRKTAAKNRKTN